MMNQSVRRATTHRAAVRCYSVDASLRSLPMRLHTTGLCGITLLGMALVTPGCTELYFVFGPGGLWGPQQGGVGASTTTQPTVIASPLYVASQIDPRLEATAGARVVVAAQLNDDNGDGVINDNDFLDLVSGHVESQPIQVHLNDGTGLTYTTYTIAGGGPIFLIVDIQAVDLDMDGRNDVAVLVKDTGFVPVQNASLRGAVVFLFAPADPADALAWQQVVLAETFVLPSDDEGMTDFAVADMNGDGYPDVVLASNERLGGVNQPDKFIRLYRNPGPALARNGNAWTTTTNPLLTDVVRCKSLELADIDGDGDLDIVASFPDAKTLNIRWLVNPLVPAGVGAVNTGVWGRRILAQQAQVEEANPGGDLIAVGDIDGDGDIDVAAAHVELGIVQWFRNPARPADPGGWQIVAQQTFPWEVYNLVAVNAGFVINQLQLVDMNRNGELDAFLTASGSMVGLQRRTPVEDMWAAYVITATNPVAKIGRCAIRDMDRDGLIDIVAPLDRDGLMQDQIIMLRRLTP